MEEAKAMRKFLIRWWYTPNWQQDCYRRMIKEWNKAEDKDLKWHVPELCMSRREIEKYYANISNSV
jgi:hypothetical protein